MEHLYSFTENEEDRKAELSCELEVASAQLGVIDLLATAGGEEVCYPGSQLLVVDTLEEVASVVDLNTEITFWTL